MRRKGESMTGSVLARAQSGDSDAFAALTIDQRTDIHVFLLSLTRAPRVTRFRPFSILVLLIDRP